MVWAMHQQLSGARPAAMAQPLGWPHKGQWEVSRSEGWGMAAQVGRLWGGARGPVYGGCPLCARRGLSR